MPEPLLRALDLTIGRRVEGLLPGDHRSSVLGRGTELAQIRPYEPGEDDVRQIDWNVTARTGEPHVRVHLAERVLVTLARARHLGVDDVRHGRPAQGRRRRGRRARARPRRDAGAATGSACVDVRRRGPGRRCRRGRAAPGCSGCCSRCDEEPVREGRRRDLGRRRALGLVGAARAQRSLVVVVSDFRGPRDWRRAAAAARRPPRRASRSRSATRASRSCRTSASCGSSIPRRAGSCASTPRASGCASAFAAAAAAGARRGRAELASAGVGHVVLSTEGDWLRPLAAFLAARGRAMSFESPLALLALLAVPLAVVGYVLLERRRHAQAARVRDARAAAERRRPRPRLAAAPARRDPAARAGGAPGRLRAAARDDLGSRGGGDGRARDRHLALDGRDRRRADAGSPPRRQRSARFLAEAAGDVPRRRRRVRAAPRSASRRRRATARPSQAALREPAHRRGHGARRRDRAGDPGRAARSRRGAARSRRASILVLSDGAQTQGRARAAGGGRAGARSRGPGLHGRVRDRGRRRRGGDVAASRSGSRCRPTRRRCGRCRRTTGGRFYAAPTRRS